MGTGIPGTGGGGGGITLKADSAKCGSFGRKQAKMSLCGGLAWRNEPFVRKEAASSLAYGMLCYVRWANSTMASMRRSENWIVE